MELIYPSAGAYVSGSKFEGTAAIIMMDRARQSDCATPLVSGVQADTARRSRPRGMMAVRMSLVVVRHGSGLQGMSGLS